MTITLFQYFMLVKVFFDDLSCIADESLMYRGISEPLKARIRNPMAVKKCQKETMI